MPKDIHAVDRDFLGLEWFVIDTTAPLDRTRAAGYELLRRKFLIQRIVLTTVMVVLVAVLPLGPNRLVLAAVIAASQAVATVIARRRPRAMIDELGFYMCVEVGIVAIAGVIAPLAYVGANMLALASLAINAPYLTRRWLRRITPITVGATIFAPLVHDVDHAMTVVAISGLLSLHMAFNRGGAVVIAEKAVTTAQWKADHDPLTGLANRRVLVQLLDELDTETEVGLLLVDLDDFKAINDTHGHAAGDDVLRAVADRFSGEDPELLVIRLGGDEFAIVVSGDSRQTEASASRLMATLELPFDVDGAEVTLNASMGLVHTSIAAPHELLRFSDIAMFHAKRLGGGLAWYSESHDQIGTRSTRSARTPVLRGTDG